MIKTKFFILFICAFFPPFLFSDQEESCRQLDLERKVALVMALVKAEEVETAKAKALEADKHLEELGQQYQNQCLTNPQDHLTAPDS